MLAVAAVLVYAIRYALLPFVFAIAIAFVVEPTVAGLARRLALPRWIAAAAVYLLVAGVLAAIVYWIGFILVADAAALFRQGGPAATDLLTRMLGPDGVTLFGHAYAPQDIVDHAARAVADAVGVGAVARIAGIGVAALFGFCLLLVLTPYFMISGPRLAAGAVWLIPPERRRSVERLLPRILPALRRYLLGVLAVVTYTTIAGWIGFGLVLGLPHASLLAVVVGLLEIVPVIGPVTAAALAALAAFGHGGGVAEFAGAVAFIVALRLSIDNLVGPIVLGQAARVHPVVVMFAFVSGSMLFGAIGLLLAVPAAVTLKIALQQYYADPVVPAADADPGR